MEKNFIEERDKKKSGRFKQKKNNKHFPISINKKLNTRHQNVR